MKTAYLFITISLIAACTASKKNSADVYHYTIDDRRLYDTIVHHDSIFFHFYNTCDVNLAAYASYYSDTLEFYHDKGGLNTSKAEVVESTKKYVCGKVSRQLVQGSIEVYPIPGFGAIEMGLHKFFNSAEPNAPQHASRFTIVWQHTAEGWKIRKVISLH